MRDYWVIYRQVGNSLEAVYDERDPLLVREQLVRLMFHTDDHYVVKHYPAITS